MDEDEEVMRLVKQRDELRIDTESSEHLNKVLKKLINKMLISNIKKRPCPLAEVSVEELICFELQEELTLIENRYNLRENKMVTSSETKHFKAHLSSHGYSNRSYICKGCNRNFGSVQANSRSLVREYTQHCVKECEEYKKLGKYNSCSFSDLIISSVY